MLRCGIPQVLQRNVGPNAKFVLAGLRKYWTENRNNDQLRGTFRFARGYFLIGSKIETSSRAQAY
jgi:hypothetical protein